MKILVLACCLVAAACHGATDPFASDTGVLVQVSLWPVDPVEVEGQPARTRPAVGARVVALDEDGDRVASATTDADGVARLLVAPGRYRIAVVECPGAMSLPKEEGRAIVIAAEFAPVALACDTGIR